MGPSARSTFLIVKAPPCSWLGAGRKALIADGATHSHTFEADFLPGKPTLHGLYCALRVGLAKDAAEFLVEGDMASGARIYRKSDRRQWLEPDHDRRDVGSPKIEVPAASSATRDVPAASKKKKEKVRLENMRSASKNPTSR